VFHKSAAAVLLVLIAIGISGCSSGSHAQQDAAVEAHRAQQRAVEGQTPNAAATTCCRTTFANSLHQVHHHRRTPPPDSSAPAPTLNYWTNSSWSQIGTAGYDEMAVMTNWPASRCYLWFGKNPVGVGGMPRCQSQDGRAYTIEQRRGQEVCGRRVRCEHWSRSVGLNRGGV